MNNITSRKADLKLDGSLLFTLDNQCFTRFYDNPSSQVSEVAEYLKDSQVYLYFSGDKPVGYFGFKTLNENETEIKVLAVRPEFQGQGIGTKMIHHLSELNVGKKFSLVTHPWNSQAVIFYLKHGFEIVGWKDDYYGDGQPRLILRSI